MKPEKRSVMMSVKIYEIITTS